MNQLKIITLGIVLLSICGLRAQQKLEKASQSVKANKDVILNLDTSHANIEIDTWNKSEVQVEAYVESKDLSNEELKKLLNNWNVEVKGSGSNISITTHGDSDGAWTYDFEFDGEALKALEELQFVMADLPEMPHMPEMPELPVMAEMPPMPQMPELPELPDGVHNINFDFDTYKKEGDKYLEKWSKEYESKYGKEYKDKMKAWAKEFAKTDFDKYSKEMEAWGEKYGESFGKDYETKMEVWSKNFSENFDSEWAKKMETWGEEYGEKFGKEYEARMEEKAKILEERVARNETVFKEKEEELQRHSEERRHLEEKMESLKKGKVIKTIKIRMPKDAKLKANVRHGELKIVSVIHNLKADLSHSTLIATSIDGGLTSINASYSPILISKWNLGELKLNYVENVHLNYVNHLMLQSNSSNIVIDELVGNAVINGSFGDLQIDKISDTFNNLNLVLENSDVVVTLPKTDFNLQYQGSRSRFQHPDKTTNQNASTFSTGNLNSNKTIVINAKYSNIVMQ